MTERRKGFCHIRTCENNSGTLESILRIPYGPIGDKWRSIISEHIQQPYVEAVSKICRLHFDPDDIIEYNGKKKGHWRVREGAIPTMFIANDAEDKPKTDGTIEEANSSIEIASATTLECPTYKRKLNVSSSTPNIDVKKIKQNVFRVLNRILIPNSVQVQHNVEYQETVAVVESTPIELATCYICNSPSQSYFRNLYETKSKHTETRICDFILRWLGEEQPSREIFTQDDNCICVNCFDKINEYDLLYAKAEAIDKWLRDTFLVTDSLFKEVKLEEEETLDPFSGKFTRGNIVSNGICADESSTESGLESNKKLDEIDELNTDSAKQPEPILVLDPCSGDFIESYESIKSESTELQETDTNNENHSETQNNKSKAGNAKVIPYVYSYSCTLCKKILDSRESLKTHNHSSQFKLVMVIKGERAKPKPKTIVEDIKFDDNKKTNEKKYKDCPKCPYQILEEEYEQHIKSHGPVVDPLKCGICCFEMKSQEEFNQHMALHEKSQSPLQCVICSYKTSNRHNLYTHIRNHQDIFSPCEKCGQILRTRFKYYKHMINQHSKPVKCPECPKFFANKSSLNSHRQVHKPERFTCPVGSCRKKFVCMENLKIHQLTHEKNQSKETQNHLCSICNKRYRRKYSLRMHMAKDHQFLELQMPPKS